MAKMIEMPESPAWLDATLHEPANEEDGRHENPCWTATGPPLPVRHPAVSIYDDEENSRFLFLVPVAEDLKHSRPHARETCKGCGLVIAHEGWRLFLRVIGYCSRNPHGKGRWRIPVGAPYIANGPLGRYQTKAAVRRACESIQEGTILRPWCGSDLPFPPRS